MGSATPPPFVLAFTDVRRHAFVPELQLRLARDTIEMWEQVEDAMGRGDLAPPYWASVWPGGLALARYVLDHPGVVAGRTVIDVATGSGVVAIAAAVSGARSVLACDADELAVAAAQMNAELNGVRVCGRVADVRELSAPPGAVVTAGDVFYGRDISTAMLEGLRALSEAGSQVMIGDPYRSFLPTDRLEHLAEFDITVDNDLENAPVKTTLVARLR